MAAAQGAGAASVMAAGRGVGGAAAGTAGGSVGGAAAGIGGGGKGGGAAGTDGWQPLGRVASIYSDGDAWKNTGDAVAELAGRDNEKEAGVDVFAALADANWPGRGDGGLLAQQRLGHDVGAERCTAVDGGDVLDGVVDGV